MSQMAAGPSKKVILIGAIGVGKTSLVRRLVHKEFQGDYLATVGFDIYSYKVSAKATGLPHDVDLVLWDSDGEFGPEIFHTPITKGASAAVIIGDVVRRSSLEEMVRLAEGCRTHLSGREYMFIINKIDLIEGKPRPELPEPLARFPDKLFWTSAKTGRQVDETFTQIAKAISRRGY